MFRKKKKKKKGKTNGEVSPPEKLKTVFHISVAYPFNISGVKLIYYKSPLFNPRLLLPSPPTQGLFAAIKSHSRRIINSEPPFSSVIFSQSFREINATDLFFGLRYSKPKSLNSIFTYTCCHAQWPSIHTDRKSTRLNSSHVLRSRMPSSA